MELQFEMQILVGQQNSMIWFPLNQLHALTSLIIYLFPRHSHQFFFHFQLLIALIYRFCYFLFHLFQFILFLSYSSLIQDPLARYIYTFPKFAHGVTYMIIRYTNEYHHLLWIHHSL
jgi:hypothetical protein